jgi:hypothetical protein
MNYVVEDDFDFFKELNTDLSANNLNEPTNNKCMISHLPLTHNYVTLQCNHSFNYIPLYKELCINKSKNKNKSRIISCPYCRTKTDKLIPFIPLPNVSKIYGINHPKTYCLPSPKCSIIIKKGNKKGSVCGNNGIITDNGIFCSKHSNVFIAEEPFTPEMEKIMKTKKIIELKQMLKDKGLKTSGVKKELIKRLLLS